VTAGTPRQVRLDLTELRTFRHRLSGRVRVYFGEDIVADGTVHLDDATERFEFVRQVVGSLLLRFPDEAHPTAQTLDQQLMQLTANAEADAADGSDTEGVPEERFAVDDAGCMTVQLFLNDEPTGAPVILTNFSARITEDVLVDDGAEQRRQYVIELIARGRRSVVTVAADVFADLG
jgi:hypothetical protein